MGTAERRKREKEQRRNSIIKAAEKVFFSRGRENASLDEIAEKSELSKGTIYLYFKNKDDLFHAIVYRGLQTLLSMFENSIENTARGIDKLIAIGNAYFEFYKVHPDYFNAIMHQDPQDVKDICLDENLYSAQCVMLSNKIFDLLTAAIRFGIEDGSIHSNHEPLKLAMVLWSHLTGVLHIMTNKKIILENIFSINLDDLLSYSIEINRKAIEKHGDIGE